MKSIAGLSTPKNISTLMHDNLPFSDAALASLFNDKFVEVASSLPRLSWTHLPVEEFPSMFHISIQETEKALLATKLHSSAGPDEIAAWFLRENACALCRPDRARSSTRQYGKVLSRHFGSQQTLSRPAAWFLNGEGGFVLIGAIFRPRKFGSGEGASF